MMSKEAKNVSIENSFLNGLMPDVGYLNYWARVLNIQRIDPETFNLVEIEDQTQIIYWTRLI